MENYVDHLVSADASPPRTLAEAAEQARLPVETARQLAETMGLPGEGKLFTDDDVTMLVWWARAIAVGMPESAILQLVRVYRDALARVAEAEVRLFHFYVHEPLAARGLTGTALVEASGERSTALLPMIGPSHKYFHRLGFARALREDMLLHLTDEGTSTAETPGQLAAGVVFTDLSSFTPLTDAMGDERATAVLTRFGDIVHPATGRVGGRVVKQIGDAFMLVFFEPQAAVSCALDVVARVAQEPSFPAARAGVHWGQIVYREGDYYGGGVNLAARIVAAAGRHQVLVSAAARERSANVPAVEFVPLGSHTLKGVLEPQELFEARRVGAPRAPRIRDLVCGMELNPSEIAARLALAGEEQVFCSETCLRRFVAAPHQYLPR